MWSHVNIMFYASQKKRKEFQWTLIFLTLPTRLMENKHVKIRLQSNQWATHCRSSLQVFPPSGFWGEYWLRYQSGWWSIHGRERGESPRQGRHRNLRATTQWPRLFHVRPQQCRPHLPTFGSKGCTRTRKKMSVSATKKNYCVGILKKVGRDGRQLSDVKVWALVCYRRLHCK